jgi:integrase
VPGDLLELIVALPRIPGNPFIFSDSTGTGHLIHLERIWRRVLKRANVTDARIHDLRRTIATNFASSGANEYMIQRMLGHSTAIAGRHYVHLANDAEVTRKFLEERTRKR